MTKTGEYIFFINFTLVFALLFILIYAILEENQNRNTQKENLENGTFPAHRCDFIVNLPANRKFVNIMYNGSNNYLITKQMNATDIAEVLFVETYSSSGCNIKVVEHKSVLESGK